MVLNRKRNSDIFLNHINEYDLVVSYIYNGNTYSYSIYSKNENVDCSKIAELFGGGGHKGASGFSTKHLVITKNGKNTLLYKLKELVRYFRYKRITKN